MSKPELKRIIRYIKERTKHLTGLIQHSESIFYNTTSDYDRVTHSNKQSELRKGIQELNLLLEFIRDE